MLFNTIWGVIFILAVGVLLGRIFTKSSEPSLVICSKCSELMIIVNGNSIHAEIVNTIISTKPSVLLIVNQAGIIVHAFISGRSQTALSRFAGQNFSRLLRHVFDCNNFEKIMQTLGYCQVSQEQTTICQLKHISKRNLVEYYNCTFSPASGNVIVYFEAVTDNVLIYEEFCNITKQHETLSQELSIAMAKLDFQLMDLERAHKKISALYRITAIVQKTVNEKEVLEEILDGITRELGFVNAAIFLLDPATQVLTCKAQRGFKADLQVPLGEGITGYAALHRELVYVPDINLEPRYIPGTVNGFSEVAIPLIVNDQVIGVLDVETSEEQAIKAYDLDLLRSLASQIAMTISHASHVTRAYLEASTDGLTNLYNYRHFQSRFSQEFKRAVRYQKPLSLLLIDIDHFKRYNDTYGHLYGDQALKKVASLIRRCCRDADSVFRYGGEEFVMILPETHIKQAYIIAERIRKAIAKYPFKNINTEPNASLTVSIGVAGYPENAASELALIDAADTALYKAKGSTRNISCIYSSVE